MYKIIDLFGAIPVLTVLLLMNNSVKAQVLGNTQSVTLPAGGLNGVYLTREDFLTNNIFRQVRSDHMNFLTTDLDKDVILSRMGQEQHFRFGSIAGYYKDGYKFRAYGEKKPFRSYGYYKVVEESDIIVYSKSTVGLKSGKHTLYYFSLSLNSKIFRFTRNNVGKVFKDRPDLAKAAIKTRDSVSLNEGKKL